jgi:serine/threonine protein kinase/TolA-binding protein
MTDETATFEPGTTRNTPTDGGPSAQGGWDDRAHQLLDDYEKGWIRGERPGAETLLNALGAEPNGLIRQVVSEAIKIELEHRCAAGERPGPGDFRARLPHLETVVDEVFAALVVRGMGSEVRYGGREKYAEGGQSTVYKAWDRKLNRNIALKKLRQDVDRRHSQARARFLTEAEATASLDHPGIVPVYDRGEDPDGLPYYTMPLVKGWTLDEAVRHFYATAFTGAQEKALAFSQLLRKAIDVALVVHYLHVKGVAHRDLKPKNIILNTHGRNNRGNNDLGEVIVLDLGLAKFAGRPVVDGDDGESILATPLAAVDTSLAGQVKGTVRYMSPEQARGAADGTDPRPDIYSVGAILYFLLTGKEPFEGITDLIEVLGRLASNESPLGSGRFGGWAPRPLEMVCRKAMAIKPEDRYSSAAELAKDLDDWLAYKPISAFHERLDTRARRWAKRHRTSLSATAASALLVAALAVGIYSVVEHIRDLRRQDEIMHQLNDAENSGRQAFTQFNLHELRAAVESARQAQRLVRPGDPTVLRTRADGLVTRLGGNLDDARSSDAAATNARDLVERMSIPGAEQQAVSAIKSCKYNPVAHYVLGAIRHHQDRMDEANQEFRKALDLRPDFPSAVAGLAHVLAHLKKFEEAKAILLPLISRTAGASEALIELAHIHYITDGTERAIDLARQAVKADSTRAEACGTLGMLLAQECQDKDAIVAYREAVRRSDKVPMTCYLLGYTLWDFGDLDEGLQFMENAYHDTGLFNATPPPRASLEHFRAVVQSRKELRASLAAGGKPLNLAELIKAPDASARLAMAEACFREGEYAAAATLYESVFGDKINDASYFMLMNQVIDPFWLSLQFGFSVRAAALASGGTGRNRITCAGFDPARIRNQAYNRFAYVMNPFDPKTLAKVNSQFGNTILVMSLSRCLKCRDLAPVRGNALDQLPTKERDNWLKLWEQVQQVVNIPKTKD